jgi:hypothetical protein
MRVVEDPYALTHVERYPWSVIQWDEHCKGILLNKRCTALPFRQEGPRDIETITTYSLPLKEITE